jgi:integrase
LESLADLKFFHRRDRDWPLFDISRQWVSRSMKEAAAGIDPVRAHPHVLRHTYGQNAVLRGVPTPALKSWLGHLSLAETERLRPAGGRSPLLGGKAVGTEFSDPPYILISNFRL